MLFPQGPHSEEVLRELAPLGWEYSPLFYACRPIAKKLGRIPILGRIRTFGKPVNPERECAEVVGVCLRELFCVHEVIAPYPIEEGTWRSTGHDIADWLNKRLQVDAFGYMDFYMGPYYAQEAADLTPVYALIFRRFQQHGLDMHYCYPGIYVAHTGGTTQDYLDHKAHLDKLNAETRQAIDSGPPPDVVAAYFSVFGRYPDKSEDR